MSTKPSGTDISGWRSSTQRQVQRVGDVTSAVLRCRFDATVENIWAACTNRDQLRGWFADVSGDLREGAVLTFDVGAPCKLTSQIRQCLPSRYLCFTWCYPGRPCDEVEVRITPEHDATHVTLEHRSDDKTDWWLGAGSGWEYALIRLNVLLRGEDPSVVSANELDQKLGPLWAAAG
jgi:uncharacterized protein YndB with AHSA1/START domain